jgi:hypothetical protein
VPEEITDGPLCRKQKLKPPGRFKAQIQLGRLDPRHQTPNPKLLNLKPETRNPKPETRNPKPPGRFKAEINFDASILASRCIRRFDGVTVVQNLRTYDSNSAPAEVVS